jgi:hypothetical protein
LARQDIADAAGVSRTTIAAIETDAEISDSELDALFDAVDRLSSSWNPTRTESHPRLCVRCAVLTTTFRGKGWVCADCADNDVEPVMPLVRRGDWELYDTSKVFAGLRTWKVRQGEGPEYQVEARSPHGCFYACGEACVAMETKTARYAHELQKRFPAIRKVTHGDDGVCVLRMPADLFPAVAAYAGAYKKRVLSEEQKARLALIGAANRFPSVATGRPKETAHSGR